jgi:hypothetical protein
MWQEIVITDVTRMNARTVCIAGINHKGLTIRPIVFNLGGTPEKYLYQNEQAIIRPRSVVRVNIEPIDGLAPPHLEDYLWLQPEKTEWLRQTTEERWLNLLKHTNKPSVKEVFEADLHQKKNIAAGTGTRSLGTLKPRLVHTVDFKTVFYEKEKRDYRMSFVDESEQYFYGIKINDLNFQSYVDYLQRRKKLSPEAISEKMTKMLRRAHLWLRLGLTRPYNNWCWIQITGIYTFPDYLEGQCFADFTA